MTVINLEECSYQNWYPSLCNHTFESILIPIPECVVEYLLSDTVVLPKESVHERAVKTNSTSPGWGSDDEDAPELTVPSFPEFSEKLQGGIRQLGGSVFVKLNWSAPKDAAWITADKTLKCTNLEDIYLLLKSSESVAHDLSHRSKSTSSDSNIFYVVLKRWQDIHPGSEYRCFVMQKKLVGISQRDCKAYYVHNSTSKFEIIEDISNFFQANIKDAIALSTYTFDIVRERRNDVTVLDVSPLGCKTKSILFSWEELRLLESNCHSNSSGTAEFRYLGEEPGFQANSYGIPSDVVDICARRSSLSLIEYIAKEVETQIRENSTPSEPSQPLYPALGSINRPQKSSDCNETNVNCIEKTSSTGD